jgi:arabinogalactan oligomer/maltooligosaccharide transport system permease protein
VLSLFAIAVTVTATEPLKLWHAYRGGEEDAIVESAKTFTKETGIDVELLAVPYDAFSAKLTSAIPHGAGPDVFIFAHERLRQFKRMDVVAKATEQSLRTPAELSLEVDGVRYGYPLAIKCLAMYRNTDLLAEPVRSTNDFERLLRPLADAADNKFGLAYEAGDFYYHAAVLFGFGGQLFDANGRSEFDTAPMAASLRFVKSLQDSRLMPQEQSGALVKSLFNERRVPVIISGPWFAGEIDPSIHYTVDPLPVVSDTGLPMKPFLGVEAAFVSSQSTQAAAADKLAAFLASNVEPRVRLGRQIPAAGGTVDDPLVAAFSKAAETSSPTPNTLEMARVWEPMKLALRGVLQGTASPDDGGKLADRRYRALNREAPPTAAPEPWVVFAAVLALAGSVIVFRRNSSSEPFARRFPDAGRALVYVGPAAAGIIVLVMIPFAVGVSLSLFHHDAGNYTFVGLGNFKDILSSHGYAITEPLSFYFTLAVTILWTAVNVFFHVSIGLALALLLKSPLLRLRGVFRVLLIVPWAVPNYITALMWKGMFHRQFGAVNGLLAWLGVEPISWFTRFSTSFAANVATNTWLGFPFMMVVALGALQSIPSDLYEAAEVDGASKWAQFRHITLPLLKPALLPAVILGTVWTFNMFNVIYLVSGGEPGGATDILVSEAFRWAFQRNEQYGFAAAYSVLIFFVLLAWSRVTKRLAAEKHA